jgi:hypothetical protein
MKKIKGWETVLFIGVWSLIMFLGADFPPPSGFWKVVACICLAAFVQWF